MLHKSFIDFNLHRSLKSYRIGRAVVRGVLDQWLGIRVPLRVSNPDPV